MLHVESHSFDSMAAGYDEQFSFSFTGFHQRMQVRAYLSKLLQNKSALDILEINCGTGEDAYWLASMHHRVSATDASCAMIKKAIAKSAIKVNTDKLQFSRCSFEDLGNHFVKPDFDLVFSNFSGVNCISPAEVKKLSHDLAAMMKPGGQLAIVIFGKYTLVETLYYLAKFKPGKAFRRWRTKPVMVNLDDDQSQQVYYYSIEKCRRLFSDFELVEKRAVGLIIPPSYLESLVRKVLKTFPWILRMEDKLLEMQALSSFSDHTYLLFKKKS